MTWASGNVVVDPAVGAVRQIVNLIEAAMTDGGWTFLEEYNLWRVWRCPVALNGIADFHLFFRINTSGHLICFIAEDYDVATHQFRRAGFTYGSSVLAPSSTWDAATQAVHGATWFALGNTDSPASNAAQTWSSSVFPGSQFDYQIRVGTKHIAWSVTWSGASSAQHIGRWTGYFDTLIATPADDPVPLGTMDLWSSASVTNSTNSNNWGHTTRMPLPFTHTNWYGANQAFGGLATQIAGYATSLGQSSASSQLNALGATLDAWGAPAFIGPKIFANVAATNLDSRILRLRGIVPGMVSFGAGSGIYLNDEFTFEGKTYSVSSYAQYGVGLAMDKAFAA